MRVPSATRRGPARGRCGRHWRSHPAPEPAPEARNRVEGRPRPGRRQGGAGGAVHRGGAQGRTARVEPDRIPDEQAVTLPKDERQFLEARAGARDGGGVDARPVGPTPLDRERTSGRHTHDVKRGGVDRSAVGFAAHLPSRRRAGTASGVAAGRRADRGGDPDGGVADGLSTYRKNSSTPRASSLDGDRLTLGTTRMAAGWPRRTAGRPRAGWNRRPHAAAQVDDGGAFRPAVRAVPGTPPTEGIPPVRRPTSRRRRRAAAACDRRRSDSPRTVRSVTAVPRVPSAAATGSKVTAGPLPPLDAIQVGTMQSPATGSTGGVVCGPAYVPTDAVPSVPGRQVDKPIRRVGSDHSPRRIGQRHRDLEDGQTRYRRTGRL